MFETHKDIEEVQDLMTGIASGQISRNKNFDTLTKKREYSRFKRAKLLISILDDLEISQETQGSKIEVSQVKEQFFLSMYNPKLRYNRKVPLSRAEITLLSQKTTALVYPKQ